MRLHNRNGRNGYVRPKGEHDLSLVDDLNEDAIAAIKREGFSPALVVRTSPGNHRVWLKHPARPTTRLVMRLLANWRITSVATAARPIGITSAG